jgi:DNA-binding response OmpR family regulator
MEAIELYEKNNVHVVLLDYIMPFMTGYDVASKIRQNDTKIPIVIASSHTDKEKLLKSIPLKLTQFLEKPIMYKNLVETFELIIKQLLENNTLKISINDNLEYNYINKNVFKKDTNEEISLTKKEVTFLELILKRPNQLVNMPIIEEFVYGQAVESNTVRNMVYRLRKKLNLDDKRIVTIKELGYMININ